MLNPQPQIQTPTKCKVFKIFFKLFTCSHMFFFIFCVPKMKNAKPTFKKLKTHNDHPWWWECVLGAGTGRIRLLTYRVPPGGDKYHTQDWTWLVWLLRLGWKYFPLECRIKCPWSPSWSSPGIQPSDCPLLPFIYIGYLSLKCSIVRLRQNKWSDHIQLLYTVPAPGTQTYNVMKNSNDSAAPRPRPFLSFHLDFVCHSLSLFPDGGKT